MISLLPDQTTAARAPGSHAPTVLPVALDRLCLRVRGRALLEDVTLRLEAGPRTVVMGPNGAGKSLLLRLCHGLIRPSSGTVRWALDDPAQLRRAQAMVFQRPVLLRRSAAANIRYALSVSGVPRGRRGALVDEALGQAGLAAAAGRSARVLSGGEKQRLALARAWALRPQVLFLDEPTANLDPAATRQVETMVAAIGALGTKIVLTTHDLGQARRLANEVIFMHRGRVVEQAAAQAFFTRPRSVEARAFLEGTLVW